MFYEILNGDRWVGNNFYEPCVYVHKGGVTDMKGGSLWLKN